MKRVSHKAAYKCNWRVRQLEHDAKLVERCRNPEVATHLLEGKVFEMIRETMFDPSKLRACVQAPVKRDGERGIAQRLARIARHIVAIEEDRKRLIELYASEGLESREYIEANRELDAKLTRLKREKREIAAGVLPLDAETVLEPAFARSARTPKRHSTRRPIPMPAARSSPGASSASFIASAR